MVEKSIRQGAGTARIVFEGRSFLLPARSPYDLELVLEHSRYLAARHGSAKIQMNGATWLVESPHAHGQDDCSQCGREAPQGLRCGGATLCRDCGSDRMMQDVSGRRAA